MILVIGDSLLLRIVWGVLEGVIAMRNAPKARPSSIRGLIYFKVDIIYIIRHKIWRRLTPFLIDLLLDNLLQWRIHSRV